LTLDKILVDFGSSDIRKITKLAIKVWLNSLKHKTTNEDLSRKTRLKYLRIFHGVYELAVDDNVLDKNFTYDIKLIGEKRDLNEIKPFSKSEVNILLESSKNAQYSELLHFYLGIAFNQGMSPSEIIGLQIGDIDLINQTIAIRRNITKGKIKETKTVYRDRVVPIFSASMPYVKELLSIATKKRSIWLFSRDDGTNLLDVKDIRGNKLLIKDSYVLKQNSKWHKLLIDCEVEYRDLKNCRHTFAVSAIESKMFTLQEISNLLGHSDLNMLINHYAKWTVGKSLNANKQVDLYGDTLGDTRKIACI
jgi:integrase